jgi:hypothetical protein
LIIYSTFSVVVNGVEVSFELQKKAFHNFVYFCTNPYIVLDDGSSDEGFVFVLITGEALSIE